MDTIIKAKDKVKLKKNGNKYRHKKRKFHGNRYTKKNNSPVESGIHKTDSDSQIDFRRSLCESTSPSTTSTSITISTQETLQSELEKPVNHLINICHHITWIGYISYMDTFVENNVSNSPLQVTSFSGDDVVQQPMPKRTKPTAKKVSYTQDVARSILTTIIKKKQQCVPNQSSTNQRQSAQISRANNGRPRASIQTDMLTSFHRNVHELMILMTDTDPGNVEDIEEVVASVLEQHGQLDD